MRTKLAALLLALALAAGCGAVPGGGPPAPPEVSAPGPSESALPPAAPAPAEPEPSPEEPTPPQRKPEPVPKTPEDYTQKQLDFFEKWALDTGMTMDDFWASAYSQERGEEFFVIVSRWLSLSPEHLEVESQRVAARSQDGTKAIYLLHDDSRDNFLDCWPDCFIWSDWTTGENRFLYASYYLNNVQDETADTLLVYYSTTLRAFSLETGKELEQFVPAFDFGEELLPWGRERVIYGIASDKGAETVVVAYANWDQRDEDTQTFPLRLAAYDREGTLIRDIATWARPRYTYKNFDCFAINMTFPQPGTLHFSYNYDNPTPLRLDYLTDPVPLRDEEIFDLWDTLAGVWAIPTRQIYGEKKKEAAFYLREGKPVLRVDGRACSVSAVKRWSDITWEITARDGEAERTFYVDTDLPKDFAILVMEEGEMEYSNCLYVGEAKEK